MALEKLGYSALYVQRNQREPGSRGSRFSYLLFSRDRRFVLLFALIEIFAPMPTFAREQRPSMVATCSQRKPLPHPKQFTEPTDVSEVCFNESVGLNKSGEPDYVTARKCCEEKGDCNILLAVIYANGLGVKPDLNRALDYTCSLPDDVITRNLFENIMEGKKNNKVKPFDYCGLIPSGTLAEWCSGASSTRAHRAFEKRWQEIQATLTAGALKELERVKANFSGFTNLEVGFHYPASMRGTGTGAMEETDTINLEYSFLETVETLQKNGSKTIPSEEAYAKADATLNSTYKEVLNKCKKAGGTQDLRAAQRAWLKYRDSLVSLFRLQWQESKPENVSRIVSSYLNEQRIQQLKNPPE